MCTCVVPIKAINCLPFQKIELFMNWKSVTSEDEVEQRQDIKLLKQILGNFETMLSSFVKDREDFIRVAIFNVNFLKESFLRSQNMELFRNQGLPHYPKSFRNGNKQPWELKQNLFYKCFTCN